jgi:hypothetical protein
MHDPFSMTVSYCLKQLLHEMGSGFLAEPTSFQDKVEQLASLAQLRNQMDELRVLVHFKQLQNVGVIHGLQDLHFGEELLLVP